MPSSHNVQNDFAYIFSKKSVQTDVPLHVIQGWLGLTESDSIGIFIHIKGYLIFLFFIFVWEG